MTKAPPKAQFTAMAGEYCVMEKLFRLGHVAALTLGNAKSIDLLVSSATNKSYKVSVKAGQQKGKWGIGKTEYEDDPTLIFVFLLYKNFSDIDTIPDAWVIPAPIVNKLKKAWIGGTYAIYNDKEHQTNIAPYKDAWHYFA